MDREEHRNFIKQALREGAHDCPGDCGMDERECAAKLGVIWAGTAREGTPEEVSWVEGTTAGIADLLLAAYEQAGLSVERRQKDEEG